MPAKNPEIRLLVRVLAIIGFLLVVLALSAYVFLRIKAPYLLQFSRNVEEHRITVSLDSLENARFIAGMNGCENLALDVTDMNLYITCLDGYIHHLDGANVAELEIIKSAKAGTQAIGITFGRDGYLYIAVNDGAVEDWMTRGGAVYRFSKDLDSNWRITENYPSINGLACNSSGDLYFASSNFKFLRPEGKIYKIQADDLKPGAISEIFYEDKGLSNGLYYDQSQDKIYYSNTIVGVYDFSPGSPVLEEVYLKLRFMEACDDLCTDISGNVWMTDPGYSTVKMYNPGTNRLVRFDIKGIGQTSSCRIRTEMGQEMLYITELKKVQKPMKQEFDGRGLLVVPTRSLIKLLEPVLIKNP